MLLPFLQAGQVEAGCDEAGRGCLAGSVFAKTYRDEHMVALHLVEVLIIALKSH